MSAKKKQKKKVKNRGRTAPPYPFEFRLRVVRLYLEDGYDASMIAQECGISAFSVYRWSKAYREQGEAGLRIKPRAAQPTKMPENVRGKIIDIKQNNPGFGARRISDILRRFFLIPASASSVQRTLSQEGIAGKKKSKATKNPSKPRFFERASANQMWQSDIMTFRLAGRNAYLIGFMDDYSRYITGIGFYRSQTTEHVLETYRRAISEYGVPKEILTDNGRQYTNWRGTTRFERELKKDRVKHIKSRPHHPMTLGKIERFWQTILNEFLQRAQFGSFEEAVERTGFWVKYYNYKRPNQGIGGLCPADRFFEIQHALKKTLEQGVEENALELALRGKPRDPFYMVGRMGEQSVVIRAEKGKVKMLVDGADPSGEKELVYDARKDIDHEENQSTQLRSAGQDHGRAVGMDRAAHDLADVQRDVSQRSAVESVAEPGHGGSGYGPESEKTGEEDNAQCPSDPADRENTAGSDREAGKTAEGGAESCENQSIVALDISHGSIQSSPIGIQCPEKSRDHYEGALRADDGISGRTEVGGIAKDLLQVGTTGPYRPLGRLIREASRPTGEGKARGTIIGETACRHPQGERNTAAETDSKGSGL